MRYKYLIFIFVLIVLITVGCNKLNNGGGKMKEITWHGQAAIQLNADGKVIQIDPFKIKDGAEKADILLITHGHFDHCSTEDAIKVSKPSTIVVAPKDCLEALEKLDVAEKITAELNKRYEIGGVVIETVPAYNVDKKFHPKESNWVGYVITVGGKRYYHAGDTDKIPEMASLKDGVLKDVDVAFLPVGGTYTMAVEEAAEAVKLFKPKKVVPMHYGTVPEVGEKEDGNRFKEKCDCEVEVLEAE